MFFHGFKTDETGTSLEVLYGETPVPNILHPSKSHCIIAKGGDDMEDVKDAFCEVGDEEDEALVSMGGKLVN